MESKYREFPTKFLGKILYGLSSEIPTFAPLNIKTVNKMKNLRFLVIALLAMVMPAASMAAGSDDTSVPMAEVRNYFHNNDAPLPESPMITTQKEFDRQFGAAAYMGKDGEPTKINFRKQAVVAIVLPVTDVETDIDSVTLRATGKKELTLSYIVRRGLKQSYSTQPVKLMAIARKYAGYAVKVDAQERQEVEMTVSTLQTVSYNSPVRGIDMQVDLPAYGSSVVADSVWNYIQGYLTDYANGWMSIDEGQSGKVRIQTDNAGEMLSACGSHIYNIMREYNKSLRPEAHCSATLRITRTDETPDYVTYEAESYNYAGGAHGLGSHTGVTFDRKTGRRMQLVKPAEGLQKLITERLHKEYADIMLDKEPVPMPQYGAFMKGGRIHFVYQPYEIGPYAIGMPECSFYPYEIEDYLVK